MQKFLLVSTIMLSLSVYTNAQWSMNDELGCGFVDENLENPQESIELNPEWLTVKRITKNDKGIFAVLDYKNQGDDGFMWVPAKNDRSTLQFLSHDYLKVFDHKNSLEIASVPVGMKFENQEEKLNDNQMYDHLKEFLVGKNGIELLNGVFKDDKITVNTKNLDSKIKLFKFRKDSRPIALFGTLVNNMVKTSKLGGTAQFDIENWEANVVGTFDAYMNNPDSEANYLNEYTQNSIVSAVLQASLGLRESRYAFTKKPEHLPDEFIKKKEEETQANIEAVAKVKGAVLDMMAEVKAAIQSMNLFGYVRAKEFSRGVGNRLLGMLQSPVEPLFAQVPVLFDKFPHGFKLYPQSDSEAWQSNIWAFKGKIAANLMYYWSSSIAEADKAPVVDKPLRDVLETLHQKDISPFSQADIQSFIERIIKSIYIDFSNPMFELMYYLEKLPNID